MAAGQNNFRSCLFLAAYSEVDRVSSTSKKGRRFVIANANHLIFIGIRIHSKDSFNMGIADTYKTLKE